MSEFTVATAPKSGTFQMRINPEIKERLEELYASCGLTLPDAVNAFFQQSINVGGLPFLVAKDSRSILHEQATALLMSELKKGDDSVKSDADWVSEEELAAEFGVDL